VVRYKQTLSAVDRVIALALTLVWIGAGAIGIWFGLRHGSWAGFIIGALAVWYGIVWARVVRKGSRLHWRESIWLWRRE
jgi:hypothetical protein